MTSRSTAGRRPKTTKRRTPKRSPSDKSVKPAQSKNQTIPDLVDRIAQLKTELRDTITTSNSEAATVFEARALEQRLAELESRARTSSGELAELSDLETHELASAVELAAAGLKKVFSENTE